MNKFTVSLLRQLLGCMQDGLSIRVTAQKLRIPKSSVSLVSQKRYRMAAAPMWLS